MIEKQSNRIVCCRVDRPPATLSSPPYQISGTFFFSILNSRSLLLLPPTLFSPTHSPSSLHLPLSLSLFLFNCNILFFYSSLYDNLSLLFFFFFPFLSSLVGELR